MSRSFPAVRPLQSAKLAAVVGTLCFGVLGYFRVLPGQQLTALLLVPLIGLCLALVITVETLVAGVRAVRREDPVTEQLTARPTYTVVRALEASIALLAAVGVVVTIVTLPDEPMAGPGAMGLLFVVDALGLLILSTSLVRTVAECYYHSCRDHPDGGVPTQ